jgi:hypothetical protein
VRELAPHLLLVGEGEVDHRRQFRSVVTVEHQR